jgi:hypothetical protein
MTDITKRSMHGTLSDEQIDRLLSDSRICAVFMTLIAEASASDEKENTNPSQSEKPIRDEGATLLRI